MRIYAVGYFTKCRRFEGRIVNLVKEVYEDILGRYSSKISEIKIIFRKNQINWSNGYRWLVQGSKIVIYVPGYYRSYWRSQWLVIHELCHARQILDKKLKVKDGYIWYRRSPSQEYSKYMGRYGCWWKRTNGRWNYAKETPIWEYEANNMSRKYFTPYQEGRAWDCSD